MAAHSTNQPQSAIDAGESSLQEQALLDEAMRRGDQLLVSSLKADDRRRSLRTVIIAVVVGILALVAISTSISLAIVLARVKQEPSSGQQAPSGPEKKSAELASEGWKLWQQQSLESAINKLEAAVQLDPKNANAWNGLGWANFNGGDSEKAEAAFRHVIALEPKHSAALNGLGQIALAKRNYDQAEKFLLEAAPQAPAAWSGLATIYLLKGNYDETAKWAQKLLATGEANAFAEELLKAAKAKKVPAELREQLEPSPSAVQIGRAWGLLKRGQHAEAQSLFQELLAKNPKDASALNGLGWVLLNSGDLDSAKPNFEKVLAIEPNAAGAMNGLARTQYAQGDVDGAIKIWQQMVEKIPGVHAGTVGLADAYLEKGEYDKALPFLEQMAAADPQNAEVQNKLKLARDKTQPATKKSSS